MKKINFVHVDGNNHVNPPEPASKNIPEWYKKTQTYVEDAKIEDATVDNETTATIKRCMPVFDAISSGYMLKTPTDFYIVQKENENTGEIAPHYYWPSGPGIEIHPRGQAEIYPLHLGSKAGIPKFVNDWIIETPPGYSCLFIPPIHHDLPFTVFSGVVDTDKYHGPINFPFMLKDINYEGTIPAGTPMVQVIPFKRDSWTMNTENNEKTIIKAKKDLSLLRSVFYSSYKKFFRQSKVYK